ncbi:MAG: hypothetical protein Q4G68_04030 [Planctomycetia bacterium]|nr:hypothetical protein [Planctomycetia bacterium]
MKRQLLCWGLIFIAVFITCGCNETNPDGITKVVPAKIHVTVGGSPLAQADLQLVGEGDLSGVAVSGQTDSQGLASLTSVKGDWVKAGAPLGNYRVVVQKQQQIEGLKSMEEVTDMKEEERKAYHAKIEAARKNMRLPFAEAYTSVKTTPLTLEITESKEEILLNLEPVAK